MARLHHMGITVSDTDRAVNFYRLVADVEVTGPFVKRGRGVDEVTGLEGAEIWLTFLAFDGGSTVLELAEYRGAGIEPVVPDNIRAGSAHPAIVVEDLDASIERVTNAGYRTTAQPYVASAGPIDGFRYVYVIGPDALRVELMEAPHGI